jgi:drug/metabolite transporter (DMT)-like permease
MISGYLAGLAAGALWGLVFIAPMMIAGPLLIDLASGRFVVYGIAALAALLAKRRTRLTWKHAGVAAGLSLLGFTGYYVLLASSIHRIGVETPALIVGFIPVCVMIIGRPHEIQWRALVPGLVATIAGIIMTVATSTPHTVPLTSNFLFGSDLAPIALAFWTAFALLNTSWLGPTRRLVPRIGQTFLGWGLLLLLSCYG